MKKTKDLWTFRGEIEVDGTHYDSNVEMSTYASNKPRALANLRYRYREDNNLRMANHIVFAGELIRTPMTKKEDSHEQNSMQSDDRDGKYFTPSLFESEYPEPAELR